MSVWFAGGGWAVWICCFGAWVTREVEEGKMSGVECADQIDIYTCEVRLWWGRSIETSRLPEHRCFIRDTSIHNH